MKEFMMESAVTIPAHTKIGVSLEQFAPRAHNLSKINESNGLITCEVLKPVQFKAGEVIFANDLPKSMASLVKTEVAKGAAGAESEFDEMSATEMKAYLKEAGVEFAGNASKKVLLDLCLATSQEEIQEGTDDDQAE